MTVKVVTDSAADLPTSLARAHGISVVPLTVTFGKQSYRDGEDLDSTAFWRTVRAGDDHPVTASPSAGAFMQVFRQLAGEGADGIVCVHLSPNLSGTYQAATMAARELPDLRVEVIDSLGVSAATGLTALRAADLAEGGADIATIAADLDEYRTRVQLYGVVDTLEFLRRGGRIGGARAFVGTRLRVKPIISLRDGIVEPVGRVRTRPRALDHLAAIVARYRGRIERLVVLDGDAPDTDALRSRLSSTVEVPVEDVWTLGPAVGAHTGPGVVGVVFVTGSA